MDSLTYSSRTGRKFGQFESELLGSPTYNRREVIKSAKVEPVAGVAGVVGIGCAVDSVRCREGVSLAIGAHSLHRAVGQYADETFVIVLPARSQRCRRAGAAVDASSQAGALVVIHNSVQERRDTGQPT